MAMFSAVAGGSANNWQHPRSRNIKSLLSEYWEMRNVCVWKKRTLRN